MRPAVTSSASSRRWRTLLGATYLIVQLLAPLSRLNLDRQPAVSGRFSWGMFTGRALISCTQSIDYASKTGASEPFPLPPASAWAHDALAARSELQVGKAWYTVIHYVNDLGDVAVYWEDLLRRYKRVIDPADTHVLKSHLHCAFPEVSPDLERDLTL